jgi:predicted GH43/DUF377 family glycosyl hydrolase
MTYVGWDGAGYQTALACSDDLLHWEKRGLLLGRGPKGSVTEHNAALTCILRDNELTGPATLQRVGGRFVGTYHAYPEPGYEAGPAVIGLCFSDDLRTWDVRPPVLVPDPSCSWEAGGLYKSWLLEHDGTYYLFYNAKNRTDEPWIEQTGFAFSRDLVTWQRFGGNPVLRVGGAGQFDDHFASDPCVLRDGDTWIMFYFGLCTDGHARESAALSDDLHQWRKTGEVLIEVGPPGSIDSQYAHKPGIIARGPVLHHFYCAVAPAGALRPGDVGRREVRGIAVATSR